MKFIKYTIVLFLLFFIFWQYSYNKSIKMGIDPNGQDVVFVIEKGQGLQTIAKNLKKQKIIDSEFFFSWYVKKSDQQSKLQAGQYNLNPKMPIIEIVKNISSGNVVKQEREIKLIEGWTTKKMDEYFFQNGFLKEREFYQYANQELEKTLDKITNLNFVHDLPPEKGLEGFFFPDTYLIFQNTTVEDIAYKMLKNFNDKLTVEMRSDIKKQNKTLYEIVTMASILEEEVKSYDDKRMVSGIFWNRIGDNKALESCASLAYILGVNKKQYTYEDTRIDSLYNTYLNPGLPPGPISNPGLDSIKAAIYPIENDYYYFLSRFDNGETVFSKTYDEHLRNKDKYLK